MLTFRAFFLLLALSATLSQGGKISKRMMRMDSSIIHQANGKLGMYLNVPIRCASVYDQFIAQLQACKSGENRGDENITHGCLVQVTLNAEENECIYDDNGNVKRYDIIEQQRQQEAEIFVPEEIRSGRPSRKEIVQFLLDLLEEAEE